jgi:hypothetical protein
MITGVVVDQRESNGNLLYNGNIKSVFTRVAPQSCSEAEYRATWGTTELSKKQADDGFLEKQLLTPTLEEIIKPYGNYVGSVGFNLMQPSTKLAMHYGMVSQYVRFHLGLICDPKAKFHIENYPPRAWEVGKVWAFDDGDTYHGTTHNGTISRLILIVDIDRKAFTSIEEETSWC